MGTAGYLAVATMLVAAFLILAFLPGTATAPLTRPSNDPRPRQLQPLQRKSVPAREILDRWTVEDRTPTPGTRSSTGANIRDAGSGSPKASAPVDLTRPAPGFCLDCVEGSGIRADGMDCATCGGTGNPTRPIGFRSVVLRVVSDADAPTVLDFPGRRGAHHTGGAA